MAKLCLVFSQSQNATDEELTAKANLYSEDLEVIPTNRLEQVFNVARKTSKSFPKPVFILDIWKDIEFETSVPQSTEQVNYSTSDLTTL